MMDTNWNLDTISLPNSVPALPYWQELVWWHDYHYQIQCQLYCTDKNWYDVSIINKDIYIGCIYKDKRWCGLQLEKMREFFFTALLSELDLSKAQKNDIGNLSNFILTYICVHLPTHTANFIYLPFGTLTATYTQLIICLLTLLQIMPLCYPS